MAPGAGYYIGVAKRQISLAITVTKVPVFFNIAKILCIKIFNETHGRSCIE